MSEQMTKQSAIETLEIFRNDYTREGSAICRAINIAIDALRQSTIEPEVRHGEWHECWCTDTVCASICTCCGKATTQARHIVGQELMTNVRYPLCPNCGADMRKESADNG